MVWLAYCSRSNVADFGFASILDQHIDVIPVIFYATVVCSIGQCAHRHPDSREVVANPILLDHPVILMHLSSVRLPKSDVPRTIEFCLKTSKDENPALERYVPTTSFFRIRLVIPSRVVIGVEGNEVVWAPGGHLHTFVCDPPPSRSGLKAPWGGGALEGGGV